VILPPDPFWPIRFKVRRTGDAFPFEMWIWCRWQWMPKAVA